MAHEAAVAEANLHLVSGQPMLDRWILIVLDGGDRLLDQWHVEGPGGVAVGTAHVAILAGLRFRIVPKLVLETAVEPLEIGQLFEIMAGWLLIDDRQIDRMTTAAHPRALHIRVVLRFDADRVVHWIG